MLSKNKTKFVNSLQKKKNRDKEGLFLVEGVKMVHELLLSTYETIALFSLPEWKPPTIISGIEKTEVTPAELKEISQLKTPQQVVALAKQPQKPVTTELPKEELVLALDAIRDPGNMGTLLRLADWFGISRIFCSPDSVDTYNPKVVQASMGAIFRVSVLHTNLVDLIDNSSKEIPVYGTFMEGENLYTTKLSPAGCIILGNEGKGISNEVAQKVTHKLHIPNFNPSSATSESLNISIAGAVVCAEFRRAQHYSK